MAQVIWKQIYKLISMAWRRRYFIAIPFVCVFIITIIISLVSPKMYRSHTSILVQESKVTFRYDDLLLKYTNDWVSLR